MADEKPHLHKGSDGTLNRLWIAICRIWCFFACIIMIMMIVAEIIIMRNSVERYEGYYGAGNAPSRGYDKDPSGPFCGYVARTNVSKKIGSIYWAASFQASIILFCLLIGIGDAAMIFKRPDNYAQKTMRTFKGTHLTPYYATDPQAWQDMEDGKVKHTPFLREPGFIAGLGFLKLFVVSAYMSQSFEGLSRGTEYGQEGPDQNLYALWVGFVTMGSIVPTALAQTFSYIRQENHQRGKT